MQACSIAPSDSLSAQRSHQGHVSMTDRKQGTCPRLEWLRAELCLGPHGSRLPKKTAAYDRLPNLLAGWSIACSPTRTRCHAFSFLLEIASGAFL